MSNKQEKIEQDIEQLSDCQDLNRYGVYCKEQFKLRDTLADEMTDSDLRRMVLREARSS